MEVINVNDNRRLEVKLTAEAEAEIAKISANANKMKLVATASGTILDGNTIYFEFSNYNFKQGGTYLLSLEDERGGYEYTLIMGFGIHERFGTTISLSDSFDVDKIYYCYTDSDTDLYIQPNDGVGGQLTGSYNIKVYELNTNFTEVKDVIAVPSEVNKIFCQQFVADSLVINDILPGLYSIKLSQTTGDNITYSLFMFDFKFESTYGSIVSPYVYDSTNARIVALKGEYSQNSNTLTLSLIDTQGNPISSPTDFHVDINKVG